MAPQVILLGNDKSNGLRLARLLLDRGLHPAVADWTDFSPRNYSRFNRPILLVANVDHPLATPMEALSTLVRKHWGQSFPIIALTASRKFLHLAELVDDGANTCIPPESPDDLYAKKIDACLQTTPPSASELTDEIPGNLLGLFCQNDRLTPLGNLVTVHQGTAPRTSWSRRTAPPDHSWRKVVTGDIVDRFHIGKPNTYLFWSKLHLFRLPAPGEYDVPEKVVLSRVGPPLAAAVDRSRLPVGADVYSLVPKENVGAGFVACLLNSRLMDFYFNRLAGISGSRLRPEVIRNAPVPIPTAGQNREFDRYATLLAHFGPNPESWIDRQSQNEVRENMDNAVFSLYNAKNAAREVLAELHF